MMQVEFIPTSEMMRIQNAARPQTSHGGAVSFAQVHEAAQALGDESAMHWFQSSMYQELAHIEVHRSVLRSAVDITPEGMRSMQADPAYRRQILALVNRDLGHAYVPQANVHIKVGATFSEYQARTYGAERDAEFSEISEGSFFTTGSAARTQSEPAQVDPGAFSAFRQQMAVRAARPVHRAAATAYQARAYGIRQASQA